MGGRLAYAAADRCNFGRNSCASDDCEVSAIEDRDDTVLTSISDYQRQQDDAGGFAGAIFAETRRISVFNGAVTSSGYVGLVVSRVKKCIDAKNRTESSCIWDEVYQPPCWLPGDECP
jgi:hypothetical protein